MEHTRLVAMGLLDTSGRWGRLASGLGGELLTRGFATGRFTCENDKLVTMLRVESEVEVSVGVR